MLPFRSSRWGPPLIAYLRRASTTMNTTLSKGAFGGAAPKPNPGASYSAKPGRNGLYGKKPLANVNMAIGMNKLAIVSIAVDLDGAIAGMI